jgi:hypothetical protein
VRGAKNVGDGVTHLTDAQIERILQHLAVIGRERLRHFLTGLLAGLAGAVLVVAASGRCA